MAMSFSLSQSLEIKVLSKRDTSGVKKISLIDDFNINGSYNFLADSMKLSTISLSLRTKLTGKLGLNLRATLDPYEVSPEGKRYDRLTWRRGNLGRIVSTGWSFGYSFQVARLVGPRDKRHKHRAARVRQSVLRPVRHDGPRAERHTCRKPITTSRCRGTWD